MIISCKEEPRMADPVEVTSTEVTNFYFIRHAEKDRSNPEDPDPELNQ